MPAAPAASRPCGPPSARVAPAPGCSTLSPWGDAVIQRAAEHALLPGASLFPLKILAGRDAIGYAGGEDI